MKTTYGVVWREGGGPLARGRLELLPRGLRLEGISGTEPTVREVPYGDLDEIRVGRSERDRLDGRPSLVLEQRSGFPISIAAVAQGGVLSEIAERLTAFKLGSVHERQTAIVVPLHEEAHDLARVLLSGEPPFDPAALGLQGHQVFLTAREAIFLFESDLGIDAAESLFGEPGLWQAAAAWKDVVAGPPRVAEHMYFWSRPAPRLDEELLPQGLHRGDDVR